MSFYVIQRGVPPSFDHVRASRSPVLQRHSAGNVHRGRTRGSLLLLGPLWFLQKTVFARPPYRGPSTVCLTVARYRAEITAEDLRQSAAEVDIVLATGGAARAVTCSSAKVTACPPSPTFLCYPMPKVVPPSKGEPNCLVASRLGLVQ